MSAPKSKALQPQVADDADIIQACPKITLQAFQACQPSEQENALLFMASQEGATRVLISVPSDQLLTLIDLTAAGGMALRKLTGVDPGDREAKPVSRWEWVKDTKTGEIVLSLTFGSGGRLDFWLPGAMPALMLEGLQAAMGQSDATPPGTLFS